MVLKVLRLPSADANQWHTNRLSASGITRQEAGLSFLGETRHGERMALGMVEVQGLGPQVGDPVRSLDCDDLTLYVRSIGTNGGPSRLARG